MTETDPLRPDEPAAGAPQTETAPDPRDAAIAALEAEKAELWDRLLRALAEADNMRKRAEKDVADARAYAMTAFARDMLTVGDNLRRAVDSVPAEVAQFADGPFKALIDGVDLTERDLIKTLERHGVRRIEPQGAKFDPHCHQAMFEAPDAAIPKGHVSQVIQPGYSIGERVLRPALVGVSVGAPTAA